MRYIFFPYLTVVALILWKDWYKGLCGLIVLVALIGHDVMPKSMLGITGVNPYNLLLLCILISLFMSARKEKLIWDMPPLITFLILTYFLVIALALFRYGFNFDTHLLLSHRSEVPTMKEQFVDYYFNGLKFVIPGLLLFYGCNSRERFLWGMGALLLMYVALAVLVLRWMPFWILVDGDALQKRAAKLLDEEIGYYRTNLAVMLAGAFWLAVGAQNYFKKYWQKLAFLGMAGLILLALLLTGGRGGAAAWVLISAIIALVKYRKYLLYAPILAVLLVSLVPSVRERMLSGIVDNGEQSDFAGVDAEGAEYADLTASRSLFWPFVVDAIGRSPVLGYGFDATTASGASADFYEVFKTPIEHPHNSYMQLMIDNGALGAIPVLLLHGLLLLYAWRMFRHPPDSICAFAGLACFAIIGTFLVAGMTGQSFYPQERAMGLWCAIGLMLRVYVEQQKVAQVEKRRQRKHKFGRANAENESADTGFSGWVTG